MNTRLVLAGLTAAMLAACGGGDDSAQAPAPAPATPVVTTNISGTAAVGVALANATVQATCAVGSGTATTAADGTFTVGIANATRPCVLSVPAPGGVMLHSVVEGGTDLNAVANITPFTELMMASMVKGDTTAFFKQFGTAPDNTVTPANIAAAIQALRDVLNGLVDLNGVDPIKDPLQAAYGNTAGNALDKKLDALMALLAASKTTLAELSAAIAVNAGPTAIQTALKPASASCAGLRSGNYRGVLQAPIDVSPMLTIDAEAMTATSPLDPGTPLPITADPSQACRFAVTGGTLLMAKSGLGVLLAPSGPTSPPAFLVPEQTIPLSEMTGNWNGLGFQIDMGTYELGPRRLTMTIDATGKVTAGADCNSLGCKDWDEDGRPVVTANADGSFDLTNWQGTQRAYAFKGTDGQLSAFIVSPIGIIVATKQAPATLPALGSTNAYWDMTLSASNGISPLESFSTNIVGVDAQAGTYTRKRDDGRIDSWKINSPVTGLRYRALSDAAAETISMSLGNSGLTVAVGANPANQYFGVSVTRPQPN